MSPAEPAGQALSRSPASLSCRLQGRVGGVAEDEERQAEPAGYEQRADDQEDGRSADGEPGVEIATGAAVGFPLDGDAVMAGPGRSRQRVVAEDRLDPEREGLTRARMLADARCRAGIRKFQEFRRTVKSKTRVAPAPEGVQPRATLNYASRSSAPGGRPEPADSGRLGSFRPQ